MAEHKKISIHVSNKKGYVWTPEEVSRLRSEASVTGILIGTLPTVAQQNVFLGLPLLLLPEEVVLLMQRGIAQLYDDSTSYGDPTSAELQSYHTARIEGIHRQMVAAEAQSRSSIYPVRKKGTVSGDGSKARQESNVLKVEPGQSSSRYDVPAEHFDRGISTFLIPDNSQDHNTENRAGGNLKQWSREQDNTPPAVTDAAATPFSHVDPSPLFALDAPLPTHTVEIPAASASLPWYNPRIYSTLDEAREAGIWTYPSNLEEQARCAVFCDLSQKGYFMGGGLKFGGDWLVYPGDPLRYHSHFVATVFPRPTSTLRPIDIVAFGRLGTATRKSHLLCGYDDEAKIVDYYSIEWAGFG